MSNISYYFKLHKNSMKTGDLSFQNGSIKELKMVNQAHSQNCKKQLWVSSCLADCLSICPSVHIEQLSFHWMTFHELSYLSNFWKSVKKMQVSLNSDKNNG